MKVVRQILYFFRKLKVPYYKNIYDLLNFRSYYAVLEVVLKYKAGGNYFEWGPGLNTEMARAYMKKVYSVEHQEFWHLKYSNDLPDLIFSPISESSCLNYPVEIKKANEKIDVAFVDGRCRRECIHSCSEARVSITVMHDSLNPFSFEPATDAAPPAGYDKVFFKEAYSNYKYYIEVYDLRTIVLMDSLEDFENLKGLLSRFYIRFGLSAEY